MFIILFNKVICIDSTNMKAVYVALNFLVFFSKDGGTDLLYSLYCYMLNFLKSALIK